MAKKYTIILEPNYPEEGYTVRVPALPGCITYGRNKEETLERAKEAIEGFIQGLQKAGELVPEEVTPVEMDTVTV
jgi:predicted RNase H-like HicB family nuclease